MKLLTILALTIAAAIPALSQNNCNIGPSTFTTTGTVQFNNKSNQCTEWEFSYSSQGFSALSVEIDGAPDSNGSPGSFAAIASSSPCTVTGSNPNTITTSQVIRLSNCYFPWMRINVSSVTGTGSIIAKGIGAASATARNSGSTFPAAGASTTYYVATTGADTNNCLSLAQACLTIGHILGTNSAGVFTAGLIPFPIAQNYVLNISDGTYAECAYVGFGTTAQKISIVGNVTTPANVVISGVCGCDYINDLTASSTPTSFCNVGSNVAIKGVTLTPTSGNRAAMTYHAGHTVYVSDVMKCIGLTTAVSYCIETTIDSLAEIFSPVTCDMTDASNTSGSCLQANGAGKVIWYGNASSGALTVSGPGNTTSVGVMITRGSLFDIHLLTGNTGSTMSVTGWGTGFLITSGATVSNTTSSVNPAITISRASGTSGTGVYVESAYWFQNTGGIQLTNLSTGFLTDSNGSITQKNCAYTNVSTHTSGTAFAPSCF